MNRVYLERILCLLLWGGCFSLTAQANNIQILNKPTLINRNINTGAADIYFKVKWENSWRIIPMNCWDAAWVFVKYRESGGEWQPVYLNKDKKAHRTVANVPSEIKVATSQVPKEGGQWEEEGVGAFIYRKDGGVGELSFDSVCLNWKYTEDQGLDEQSEVSLKVFVIEMVYVPKGPFYFGYYPMQTTPTTGSDIAIHPDSGIIYSITGATTTPFKKAGGVSYSVFDASALANIWYPSAGAPYTTNNVKNSDGFVVEASDWVRVHRNSTNAWALANVPLWQRTTNSSTWTYWANETKTTPSWHEIKIEMPSPYKATHFYSRYTQAPVPMGFYVQGSHDGKNWNLIAGTQNPNTYTAALYPVNMDLELESVQDTPYKWYKFNYYTAGQLFLGGFGPMDKVINGTYQAENEYYYNLDRPYLGAMPLKVMRSVMQWTGATATPINEPYVYSSPTYPSGYESFYIMKHELSQQAYIDFLNTLNVAQQRERAGGANPIATNNPRFSAQDRCWIRLRDPATSASAVYGLMPDVWEGGKGGNPYSWDDLERNGCNIAMSCLGWMDVAAYLCWSCLRPLTEMEYEKACRGTLRPIYNEYAWGQVGPILNSNIPPLNYNLADEMHIPARANFIKQYSGTNFPLRVGCLATENSTRADAGVGYYGALNLSDNVSEYYISVTHPTALAFDGAHGSGILDGMGQAEMPTWPSNGSGNGLMVRGIYANDENTASVSSRTWRNTATTPTYGNRYIGCRGGRTAPK